MEPPQFQSPTLSAISPNIQAKNFFNDDEDKYGAHFIKGFDGGNTDVKVTTEEIPDSPQKPYIFDLKLASSDIEPPKL